MSNLGIDITTLVVSGLSLGASIVVPICVAHYNNKKIGERQERAIFARENKENKDRQIQKLRDASDFLSKYDFAINKVFNEYEDNNDIEGFSGESKEPFKKLESEFPLHFFDYRTEAEALHEQVHLIFKPEHLNKPSVYISGAKKMYNALKSKLEDFLEEERKKIDSSPTLTPENEISKKNNKKFWRHKKMFDKEK